MGRGTTDTFQILGAPDKKYGKYTFIPKSLPGFDKNPMHKDQTCYGVDLRKVNDLENGFSLNYFIDFFNRSEEGAAFFDRASFFELLMGTDSVRKAIIDGQSEKEIRDSWEEELDTYRKMREKYLLYK